MILNRLRSFGWKYAMGEVLLIFIGITLSLFFDRWNDERKERELELKLLRELSNNWADDIKSHDFVIKTSQEGKIYDSLALRLFVELPEFSDTLSQVLSRVTLFAVPYFSNSAYESISNAGLSIISNDSIRLDISQYHAFKPNLIKYSDRLMENVDHIMYPIIEREFRDFEIERIAVPYGYSDLRRNRDFIGILRRNISIHKAVIESFTYSRNELEKAKKRLDKYIQSF